METKILIQPIISEKSFDLAGNQNKYCFKVASSTNKIEIAKAVEKMFDVKVEHVRTLNVRPKKVRFGKTRAQGTRSGWKKAIVKLAEGDKIELFDVK